MAAHGNDCRFYYNSHCEKGRGCPFRHSEPAKYSSVTCSFWRKGRCTKPNCSYRHSDFSQQKTFCYYESQPSGCSRRNCEFQHLKPRGRTAQNHDLSDTHAVGFHEGESDFLDSDSNSSSEDLSAPGTPWIVSASSESVMLAWREPEYGTMDIESYKIGYKDCSTPGSKWKFIDTERKKTTFTVRNLKTETEYVFKICTVNSEGENGVFSNLSEVTSTRSSLAISVKSVAAKIEDGCPQLFKIPLSSSKSTVNHSARTKKCYFGKKKLGAKGKTIMLVGATGSGKSTLIDGIINYVTGVTWEDNFRFTMVDLSEAEKKRHADQTQSQTEWITCYTIRTMAGSNLDYDLHVVDTPGFSDTRGIQRDKAIIDQIREFFTTKGSLGIVYLDAVCFVVQAPLARLTPPQKYLFDAILSIFGQDIANNIYVLITFADGNKPPVIDALKAAKVPYKKTFKFNNSALFGSPKHSDESKFGNLFWQMGKDSFDIFFEELRFVETKSLQLTTEVLNLRKNLEATIDGLQPQIHEGMNVLNTLRQEKEILQKHENNIDANKSFVYEVDEIHMKKIDLDAGTYVTNCLTCNRTCHFPCQIAEDREKMHCAAMRQEYCTVCPGKCHWNIHRNNDFRFVTYSVKVKKSYEELKRKYQTAKQQKEKQKSVIEQVKHAFHSLYSSVMKMMRDVRSYINTLDQIAIRRNPLTDIDYIDLLMESEKGEKKYGWQERLKLYKKMREEAELVAKASSMNIKPWGEVGDVLRE